jgi:pseudaminic acid biosynthesis-associated methylase
MAEDGLRTAADYAALWGGAFGDAYTQRNDTPTVLQGRILMFARILQAIHGDKPRSCLDLGCNVGLAIAALKALGVSDAWGVDPNREALGRAIAKGNLAPERAIQGLAHKVDLPDAVADLVVTSGLLVYVPPMLLAPTLAEAYRLSRRYIVISEYFADKPESPVYHGREGVLFKNDFGAVMLDQFPNLSVVDYGFFWKRATGLDNVTWWLFEKRHSVHAVS